MAKLDKILKHLLKERTAARKELEKIETAVVAFEKLVGKAVRKGAAQSEKAVRRARRQLSAAARKKISAAQKMRWAKLKQQIAKKVG